MSGLNVDHGTGLVIPKGITRYEYGRTRGWLARVYWTQSELSGDRLQKVARKLFSDGVYGGERESLAAAVHWQSEQRASCRPREKKRLPGYGYVQRTTRRYRTVTGELRSYEAFEAWFWDAEERPCSTSWSIDSHGETLAYSRCEAWLEQLRAELALEPLARAG